MKPNTLNQVTGILMLINALEPTAFQLVKSLMDKANGKTAAEIAALADSNYALVAATAANEIGK